MIAPGRIEWVRETFDRCGTDKGAHGYSSIYAALKPPDRMLEIGVQYGCSLRAFRTLWPYAETWGIDLTLEHLKPELFGDPQIRLVGGNAASDRLVPLDHFDLIVEDASHIPSEQASTFRLHWSCLRTGGIYIIEDVTDPHYLFHQTKPHTPDLIRTGDGFDDCVLLYHKK